jgi:hypothetical protein
MHHDHSRISSGGRLRRGRRVELDACAAAGRLRRGLPQGVGVLPDRGSVVAAIAKERVQARRPGGAAEASLWAVAPALAGGARVDGPHLLLQQPGRKRMRVCQILA